MDINKVAEISTDHLELLELRKNRILLNPIGTLPKYSQQNANLGFPIAVMDYQRSLVQEFRRSRGERVAQEKGKISLQRCVYDPDPAEGGKPNPYELVYRDLTLNYGYFVQQGCKFGCDFVLYERDPQECHSSILLNVLRDDQQLLSVRDLLLWQRVSNQVNKKAALALVERRSGTDDFTIRYVTFGAISGGLKIIK
ncbi:tRNA-intron endonuclease catalytic domain-like protein [Cryptosporidium felis]|nr:tRNA-intron endonuclease catalytic domain-like protein [Cryptosporidium felis]